MKRVFIVHGWGGHPEEGWFPWLKDQLEIAGLTVFVPQLPESGTPRIRNWVPALAAAVGRPDEQTFFVGHSMGVQTIVRYLASLPDEARVGGAVFVAGFFTRLTGLNGPEERAMAHEWLEEPLDLKSVQPKLGSSIALFSSNDPYVPADNIPAFTDQLGSKITTLIDRGHFSGSSDHCYELPEARDALIALATRA